jgi:hypothetical protein
LRVYSNDRWKRSIAVFDPERKICINKERIKAAFDPLWASTDGSNNLINTGCPFDHE